MTGTVSHVLLSQTGIWKCFFFAVLHCFFLVHNVSCCLTHFTLRNGNKKVQVSIQIFSWYHPAEIPSLRQQTQ